MEHDGGRFDSRDLCQEKCEEWKDLGCNYWIFTQKDRKCIFMSDGEKKCKKWGGHREPDFDFCTNYDYA